jgi:CDP-glycerol glycerophosphotransferase (TagB/SpsB family)
MAKNKFLFYVSQNYAYAILRPLQAQILARGDEVCWFLEGSEINADYLTCAEQRLLTVADIIKYNPAAVFVPGNLVPGFIPGLKVAVFHGFNVQKRSDSRGHFNIRGCFDLYCTQGPNTTETFQQLAQQHQFFSVAETGWPAIDPLYFQEKNKSNDRPTILLCSTFSKKLTCAATLFETVNKLSRSGKWRWLVQFHPKMAIETVNQYKSIQHQHLTFIETDNVIPLLQQADVMVCDTSSVSSMFLLLHKPVVTFKNASPKDYFIDIDDVESLEQSIQKALNSPATLMQSIQNFIDKTHPYKDGKSSSRVLAAVDDMLAGNNLASKTKPLNLIRSLKMRKNLGFWQ